MVFTNAGKQFVAWGLGSDIGAFIGYVGVGSGSGTALVTDTTLIAERDRVAVTGSPDFGESRKITLQGDFNSLQMSGITLTEFGLFNEASGTGFPGSIWLREGFGSIVFDGTNELQISTSLEVL